MNHLHIRKLFAFDMKLGPEAVLVVGLEAEPVAFGDEGGGCVGEGLHFADDVAVDVFFPAGNMVEEEHRGGGWWGIDDRGADELIDDVHIAPVRGGVGGDCADGGDVDIARDNGDAAVLFAGECKQAMDQSHSFFLVWSAGPVVSQVVFQAVIAGNQAKSGLNPLE